MSALDVPSGRPATIPTPEPSDPRLARLSLNQWTTKGWPIPDLVAGLSRRGIGAVGLWRQDVAALGLEQTVDIVREAGLRVSSLCRGGFLTGADEAAVLGDNIAAIEEAAALGADTLVWVVGGQPVEDGRPIDVVTARDRVAERLALMVPVAREHGVRVALEPLHPMFCADRAVISTLAQAIDLAEPHPADAVGVVVDTFHVWWEPDLEAQIARAGERIFSYQLAEWVLPLPAEVLNGRGMMGDGYVDFAAISRWVAATGYAGDIEVEIFNEDVWAADPDDVVTTIARRYVELVQPHL